MTRVFKFYVDLVLYAYMYVFLVSLHCRRFLKAFIGFIGVSA